VPQHFQTLRRVRRENLQATILLQRLGQVDELTVPAGDDGISSQAPADLGCHFRGCCAPRNGALGFVGQSNGNGGRHGHASSTLLRKTEAQRAAAHGGRAILCASTYSKTMKRRPSRRWAAVAF